MELTFQRCMKEKTSNPNKDVADESYQKDFIMIMLQTVPYAFAGKVHKQ